MIYKKLFILAYLALIGLGTFAQENIEVNQEHLDKLIITAIQNSTKLDKQQIELNSTDYQTKMLNNEHLSLFFISGNLNEYSIRELSGDNTVPNFYPRYNLGVNVRLNHFSEVKNRKKLILQEQQLILKDAEEAERDITAEVTKKYISYLKQKKIYNIKKTLEQFSIADFNALEQKFIEGELDIDKYNNSRRVYYSTKVDVINAESDLLTSKTELESFVGSTLATLGIE
ncbi:TolC family protein [Reichenbachiella agarivorans]|uniref:TolC family protein n=1 Tax=Reichenbachiella agarivorans TaxID=2979464 RepID=A0ABY6CPJ6_9BACT|nr:TolC family protein [Reichenbachiella agarivorans]UXP32435.1 TolC family protein [Reichenbachiella agarivorans]